MISYIAQLYVNTIEPGLRIFAIVALIMMVLYVFNMIRGAKDDFVSKVVNGFFRLIYKTIVLLGVVVAKSLKSFIRNLHLVFAVVRDFFTSKDL